MDVKPTRNPVQLIIIDKLLMKNKYQREAHIHIEEKPSSVNSANIVSLM